MAFKCTNKYCRYGDGYANNKRPIICEDGTRPEHTREDAYSQDPAYRQNGNLPWDGLCLNCIDDDRQNAREDCGDYAY